MGQRELTGDLVARRHTLAAAVVALALLTTGGCGSGSGSEPEAAVPGSPAPVTATPTAPAEAPTDSDPSQPPTTAPDEVTTTAEPVETPTPGEEVTYVPYGDGTAFSVIGVAHDDVLNVRSGPGAAFEVIDTLGPEATDVVYSGRAWSTNFYEVSSDGTTGWASGRYLAPMAGTHDETSRVIDLLGARPEAPTMQTLGRQVAEVFVPESQEGSGTQVVMSVAPSVGDVGEVAFDVVGLFDDSVYAHRVRVFGQPSDGAFSLGSVEVTAYCMRGGGPSGETSELCP